MMTAYLFFVLFPPKYTKNNFSHQKLIGVDFQKLFL